MKKSIFTIIACLGIITTTKAQIPNFSFENWTNAGTYEIPDMWGTMNNTTKLASIYTATKATPGSPGNSYIKLTSKTVGTSVVNGIAVSGKLDSLTMTAKSGFAFAQRPFSLTGKWQHMIYGSSQGSIQITLTRWDVGLNQRVTVASANQVLSGMAMSWANFTIPLTYADGNFPDTCIITMKASGNAPTNNDYLWIDNLLFAGSVTGINKVANYISSINIFPNPATEKITVELNTKIQSTITLQIIDVTGKLISENNIGEVYGKYSHELNTSGIAKGTYFLKISTNDNFEVKKIIIE